MNNDNNIRGRIPGHYQNIDFRVVQHSKDKIIVQDEHPQSTSHFKMTIFLDQQLCNEDVIHLLLPGEKEMRCTVKWIDTYTKGWNCYNGEAAFRKNGSVRCDSLECLDFWMELTVKL